MSRPGHKPGTLERAVIAATKQAPWLDPAVDSAGIWTARALAEELDTIHRMQPLVLEGMGHDDSRAAAEIASRLQRALETLCLTPASRARNGITRPGPDLADELSAVAQFTPRAG